MNKWKTKNIDLGNILVNKKQIITFHSEEDLVDVVSLQSSCGCSKPKQKCNDIIVSYTPTSVPTHLQEQGFYKTKKTIIIRYSDKSEDILTFSAKVFKNKK